MFKLKKFSQLLYLNLYIFSEIHSFSSVDEAENFITQHELDSGVRYIRQNLKTYVEHVTGMLIVAFLLHIIFLSL